MPQEDVLNVGSYNKVLSLFLFLINQGTLASELREEIWLKPGETVDLSCRSEELERHFPQLVTRWTKDGRRITEAENAHLTPDKGIRLSNLRISDSGVYVCQAKSKQTEHMVVSLNTVRLHVGASIQEELIRQGGPWLSTENSLGIPNLWEASFAGSIIVFGAFWILLILMRVYYKLKIRAYDKETPVYNAS